MKQNTEIGELLKARAVSAGAARAAAAAA